MTAREAIKAALKCVGKTEKEAAESIGLTKKQLSDRTIRGSLRADTFLNLLDEIGVDVTFTVRESGKAISTKIKGAGHRVKQMVNGVIYDTADSDAMANNFYADGVNRYIDGHGLELYVSRNGQYFFAEYSSYDGVKDRISPITAEAAAQFIEKYGTDLNRQPKEVQPENDESQENSTEQE